MSDPVLVITGATGFLGRELVHHLLATEPTTRLALLVRGRDEAQARARGAAVLRDRLTGEALAAAARRVEIVRADLERDDLGLDAASWARLAGRATGVIHGAASVSFSLPLAEARAINVEGTRRMLDLANAAECPFDYVGTAYVAGDRRGTALETELDVGQPFHNSYEQTKLESEQLVRARAGEQRVTIYRPSIIVGDSRTGRTSSFKVLYWPLKVFARGFRWAPGRPDAVMDVVPSDFVVQAICHLRKRTGPSGQAYHLCAGPERAATLEQLTTAASRFFGCKPAVFVRPDLFVRARPWIDRFAFGRLKRILTTGRVYTPYLSLQLWFDTAGARAALAGTDLAAPAVEQFFLNQLRFARDTDFGKKLSDAEA
ncbi:SDR family oxidoreductase [Nannocystis bainbridge]|uniref:SDR family oxidoreductase n=1 Tax=Nannocystis bainbridge TaxID=2995303 RepID=A0ABT5EDH8_9BACT|nr:SDR family oxidoreductase [Nannocystis bainbridge]MDC0723369.1 SDR family oxidoreductase [Nannocystis bainbridge]